MADAKDLLKDVDAPEEVKTKIAEILNPILTKNEADLADANGRLQTAIDLRQSAKAELKDLREKFANGDFDGKKDLEAQIKLKELEVSGLTEKTKTLEADLTAKNEELKAVETETRETLKERFSDEKWEVVKDLTLPKLRELAKLEVDPEPAAGDKTKRMKTFGNNGKEKSVEDKIATAYKS